jgi:hypothetical protein
MSTELDLLIADLHDRERHAHQERRAQRRARHEAVIAEALRLQAEGRITGQQVAELHALRLRLDEHEA